VDNTKQSLTTLSLCTGYGGIERGLELAGEQLNVLAHVEIEAFAIANLVAKMEQGKLAPSCIWTDVKSLPVEPFRDRVDLITGGYPCQPFSAAGKRAGKDDPRHLWPYIADIIRAVRPVRCFFENVEGHITIGLREVISDLESLGYTTAFGIFSATEVGAPHQRKRVYILADSQSLRVQRLRTSGEQEPSPHGKEKLSVRESKGREQTLWDAEPNVGRVVDGCANRVDRIRLLGNGVVPQTSAKAWQVLNEELAKNE
jgi:DNA (cytosine-5)-methyltransferase 1